MLGAPLGGRNCSIGGNLRVRILRIIRYQPGPPGSGDREMRTMFIVSAGHGLVVLVKRMHRSFRRSRLTNDAAETDMVVEVSTGSG